MRIPVIITCALIGFVGVAAAPVGINPSTQISVAQDTSSVSKPYHAYHSGLTFQHEGRIVPARTVQKRNNANPNDLDDDRRTGHSGDYGTVVKNGIHHRYKFSTPINNEYDTGIISEGTLGDTAKKLKQRHPDQTSNESKQNPWFTKFFGLGYNGRVTPDITVPIYAIGPNSASS